MSLWKLTPAESGILRAVQRIELTFKRSYWLRKGFYAPWVSLSKRDKTGYRAVLRKILREELLGRDLQRAIAATLLKRYTEDTVMVQIELPLYRYLLHAYFAGNERQMLLTLRTWREQ